tara:strand:+ start:507 stop:1280 length:774 start_codon:yes stop_codon:yes gene_type:complete
MANTLSKTGITTGDTVKTWHVTQSVDAFTGIEAYDITISGSLTLGSGTSMAGTASYAVTSLSSSHASFANTSTSASFANTSTSASYAISASYALNGGGGGGDTFPFTGSAIISGSLTVIGDLNSPYTSINNSSGINASIESVGYAGGIIWVDLGQSATNAIRLNLDTIPTIPTTYTFLFSSPTPGANANFRLTQGSNKAYGNILSAAGGLGQFISASAQIQSSNARPFPDTKIELASYSDGWNIQIYTVTGSDWTLS